MCNLNKMYKMEDVSKKDLPIEGIVFLDKKDPEKIILRSGIHITDSDLKFVYGQSICGKPLLAFNYKVFINRLYGKDYKKVKDKCNTVLKELDTIQSVIGEQPILEKVKKSIENYHKELINFIQDHFTTIELNDDKN